MELYENYLKMFNLINPKFIQAYMVVAVDRTMVFKEVNSSPLTYLEMQAQYKGTSSYPYADATIRKLSIRSFNF